MNALYTCKESYHLLCHKGLSPPTKGAKHVMTRVLESREKKLAISFRIFLDTISRYYLFSFLFFHYIIFAFISQSSNTFPHLSNFPLSYVTFTSESNEKGIWGSNKECAWHTLSSGTYTWKDVALTYLLAHSLTRRDCHSCSWVSTGLVSLPWVWQCFVVSPLSQTLK